MTSESQNAPRSATDAAGSAQSTPDSASTADAPPAGKGWRQIKVIVPAVFLAAGLIAAFIYRHQRLADLPDPGDPFAAVADEVLAHEENAFADYAAAANQLVAADALLATERDEALERGWDSATPNVRDWLAQNRPALDHWRRGAAKPAFRFEERENLVSLEQLASRQTLFDRLSELAKAARLEAARLEAQGDVAEAWNWHRAVFRCGRHRAQHGLFDDRIAGTKLHELAVDGIRRWSAAPGVDADLLSRALADVREDDRLTPSVETLLRNEYIAAMRRLDDPEWFAKAGRDGGAGPIPLFFLHEPEYSRRVVRHVFANWRRELVEPLPTRQPLKSNAPRIYAAAPEHADAPVAERLRGWLDESVIAPMTLPAVPQLDEAILSERARQTCLLAALAVQRAFRTDGRLPERLDELVGEAFETPTDPYSLTGEPIRYRREDAEAIVWSVGSDGVDGEGRSRLEGGVSDDIGLRIDTPSSARPPASGDAKE
ncbi:MAG: hypothetical protein WD066_01470 [Planctomycetaceae bacterium]